MASKMSTVSLADAKVTNVEMMVGRDLWSISMTAAIVG